MGYDALLRVTWFVNPAGERQSRNYGSRSQLSAETTFAGITRVFQYDAGYRVVSAIRPDFTAIAFRYDEAGRLLERRGPGTLASYEYDARGRLVTATLRSGGRVSSVTMAHDEVGRVVREVQSHEDWSFTVDRAFDVQGRAVTKRYSSGWQVAVVRTKAGTPASLQVGAERLAFFYDALGREVTRERPGSAQSIQTDRDENGLPIRVVVRHGGAALRERTYSWSTTGPLTAVHDSKLGTRSYELDAMGRPLVCKGLGVEESFAYSREGMPTPKEPGMADDAATPGPGPGGRPLRTPDGAYLDWDVLGRLAARRAPNALQSWQYGYDDNDRLVSAVRGDGARIEYAYDAMGRRIAEMRGGIVTRFGWDGDSAVEEQPSDGVHVRRIFADDGYTPLLESVRGEPFRMVATDAAGTPWAYVDPSGGVAEIDLTTTGKVAFESGAPGSLRFAGQRADALTGLSYQRFRYYAPDLGLFMTPDPLGLLGSPYDIGFVANATYCVDPLGLNTVIIQGPEAPGDQAGAASMADAAAYDNANIPGSTVVPWSAVTPGSGVLSNADNVIIDAHGLPGQVLLGSGSGPLETTADPRLLDGTTIGNSLTAAGFKGGPNRDVIVGACQGATTPSVLQPGGGGTAQAIANTTGSPTWGARPLPGQSQAPEAGDVMQSSAGAPTGVASGAFYEYLPGGKGNAVDATPSYTRVEQRANVACLTCGAKNNPKKKKDDADGTAAQGHPVDVMTGAMFTTPQVDFTLPGFFALPWIRTYSTASASTTHGLGFGWTHDYLWTAESRGGDRFLVTSPQGEELEVVLPPEGTSVSLLHARVIARQGDRLVLQVGDHLWRVLRRGAGGVWRLTELVDASGNVARLGWTDDLVTSLVDTAGRRADLVRQENRLVWRLTAAEGEPWFRTLAAYEIDGHGDLVSATDANGRTTRYRYDEDHHMVAEQRADGLIFRFRYAVSGDCVRCVETWGELIGADILEELGMAAAPGSRPRGIFHARLEYGPEPYTTTAIDAAGGKHRYEGNAFGLVTKYTDPRGIDATYTYDDKGALTSTTDGLGRKSTRTYDERGRLVSLVEPGDRTTLYRYDEAGDLHEVLGPDGGVWKRRLDERGRLAALTDPSGAVLQLERDARGQLTRVTWPDGGADTMAYDASGNRTHHTRAGLGTWTYEYDRAGTLQTFTDASGEKTSFVYDEHGNVVATHRPGNARTEYQLDALKRRVVTRYASGTKERRRYVADAVVEFSFEGP